MINAAHNWSNNAAMMADVAKLWIKDDDLVLDPTYGQGNFWKKYRPKNLTGTDLDPTKTDPAWGPVDFTNMPWPDSWFDVVVFDPTYVTPGGRKTSTIKKFNNAYGMDTAKKTLAEQWDDICKGMTECVRVSSGLVMQKVMNYISSGKYWDYEFEVIAEMRRLGLTVVDKFHLVKKFAGPQPKDRTRKCPTCKGKHGGRFCSGECDGTGRVRSIQHHASNNMSTLIVAKCPS
jgi:hypothetical protein